MIKVSSKKELGNDLKKVILTSLEKYLGRKVELEDIEYILDKKILAGIKIEVDSEIIDLTLNHRLDKIIEVLNNNA